jgi:hypothetical protein
MNVNDPDSVNINYKSETIMNIIINVLGTVF